MYVGRNPKDCCVSYFHHVTTRPTLYGFGGEFNEYAQMFLDGKCNYGSYWDHVKVNRRVISR